jgi:transposase
MTTATLDDRTDTGVVEEQPDPGARARRRTFTAEYKARILDEYDGLPSGCEQRGALLRRECLYSSHIAEWRKAREEGARKGLAPKGKTKRTPERAELAKLRRRNETLQAELDRTKLALEITGKAHALLEMLSESADSGTKPKP